MVKKEKEKEDNSGTGYEDGQYPFVLYNRAVLRHETDDEITNFRIIVRIKQVAKRSDRQGPNPQHPAHCTWGHFAMSFLCSPAVPRCHTLFE